MKKLILVFFISLSSLSLFAQDTTKANRKEVQRAEKRSRINSLTKQEEEGVLSYYKQSAFGVELRTNGYGLFYELGRMKSPRITNLYSLELSEIKHPKEARSGSTESLFANSYKFGKINNFYQAKLGFGQQYILGQKGNKNGVAVLGIYQAGVSIGLLKPYYLEVVDSVGGTENIRYSVQDSARFLDQSGIVGGAGFTKGLNEMTVKPGAFAKVALRFDFGRYNESIQALEVGFSVDAYAQKIDMMLLNKPKQLFYQGHVAFVFGRRK